MKAYTAVAGGNKFWLDGKYRDEQLIKMLVLGMESHFCAIG
ncbi:MAG: hypothetical protein ACLTEE_11325 [Anaerobutyricum hallii]